jgi:CDP-ribitol ribitolphosphotransferase
VRAVVTRLEYRLAAAFMRLLRLLFGLLPIRRGRIVFASPRHATLEGNLRYLHDAVAASHPERERVLLLEPYGYALLSKVAYFLRLIRGMYYLFTSELFIVDNAYFPIHVGRHRPETTVVQVWHAAGALKRFGLDGTVGEQEAERAFLHRHYDYVVTAGRSSRGPYASALRTPVDRVLPLGTPRTDFFFDAAAMRVARERLLARYPKLIGRRVVLYAPTFRGRGEARRAATGFDAARLRALLPDDHILVLKTHPNLDPAATATDGFDVVIDPSHEVNEVFTVADVLVTDYSSSLFEWALLRRPLVLFVPDLDEYADDPGMYLDYRTEMIGTQVADVDAAADAIINATVDVAATDAFIARHLDACDGSASRRFVEAFLEGGVQRARLHADVDDHD